MSMPPKGATTLGVCGSFLFSSFGSADLLMENNETEFRVILLTHGGGEAVLLRLAQLDNAQVAGVFIEEKRMPVRSFKEKLRRSLKYDGFLATIGKMIRPAQVENSVEDLTVEMARNLDFPVHFVSDFHDAETIELMRAARADLGVIYGTNIIKESVFSLPRLGSINLHQGLAPFYRGSAPVFWELYNDEPEVGITVHRVAAKVDAGDIVLQETVPLRYDFERYDFNFESFIEDFRAGIKEKCAALVAESVRQIADETANFRPQDISLGTRYKLPTKREKDELKRRLRQRRKKLTTETQRHREKQGKVAKNISSILFFCLCASVSLW
jgi:folate-dependent phosphoribosylglycinamide formyltransferase PurN